MTSGGPPDGEPAPRTVVSVELKGASGESVRIHLSDGSFFVLHAEVFARGDISTGTPIGPERESRLLSRSEHVLARLRALSLLSRSAQTRQGLTRKLRARGFSAAAVAHAIERVSELGYLDDRAFAESWVQSRMAQRREGVKALTLGLMRRGVAKSVAEEVASAACSPEDELEAARQLAAGRASRAAIRLLTGRGFRARTIAAVLRELKKESRPEKLPGETGE
jgi:regulatory protein